LATYNDVLDAWIQSASINVKESTYVQYLRLVETHIRPQLGKYNVSKMSTKLVERFVENQLNNGRLDNNGGLSSKTVTGILRIVKNTMEYAQDNNLVVSCNLRKLTVKKKEKEMRVLCQSEQDALIRILITDMDSCKFGVLLALYTGIRIGELCALQWEDLSLSDSILKVRKTMQRMQETTIGAANKTKVVITEPKSDCSVRDIPLPSFLVEIAGQFAGHPKAFILSGQQTDYVEPRTMQYRFKKYISEGGIDDANFHALRHTFATRCVEAGFEIKSLSEILGHSSVNMTLNKYVHSSFALKLSNMNKLVFLP
jgi:integrase